MLTVALHGQVILLPPKERLNNAALSDSAGRSQSKNTRDPFSFFVLCTVVLSFEFQEPQTTSGTSRMQQPVTTKS